LLNQDRHLHQPLTDHETDVDDDDQENVSESNAASTFNHQPNHRHQVSNQINTQLNGHQSNHLFNQAELSSVDEQHHSQHQQHLIRQHHVPMSSQPPIQEDQPQSSLDNRRTTMSTLVDGPIRSIHMQTCLSGYLLRKFKHSSGWQKLWVVLTNFCLFFYKTHNVSVTKTDFSQFLKVLLISL